jgi:hypothetical protein
MIIDIRFNVQYPHRNHRGVRPSAVPVARCVGEQPVRISSMVLLVALYAFYYRMYSLSLYITTCHARDGVSDTPEHSNDIYLPSSSLIGDTDAVAWLRAARCTAMGRHRASQAAIACTASLHRTPPFQAAKSKALLVLSGRGAAVALVAARQDLGTLCARTAHAPTFGPKPVARGTGRTARVRL